MSLAFEVDIKLIDTFCTVLEEHGDVAQAKRAREAYTRWNSTVDFYPNEFWDEDCLTDLIVACKGQRGIVTKLKGYLHILRSDDGNCIIKRLDLLPDALAKYLSTNAIDGWVYELCKEGDRDVYVPYVVEDIYYHPMTDRQPAYVSMRVQANICDFQERQDHGGVHSKSYTWSAHEVAKRDVAEVLFAEGLLKESEELKQEYLRYMELFNKYQPQHHKQFLCNGHATEAEQGESRWRRTEVYRLSPNTKMVNDEDLLGRKITINCSNDFWRHYGVKYADHIFSTIPVHPYIVLFDLERHTGAWVHVANMKEYVYDPTLRDKLVLPAIHRDLIEVLTTDIEVFADDIIAGKGGGTAILCFGEPGLGKTLTAEVYSEVIQKPLYRVHAGQLGATITSVEEALEEILKRAERWGAVLLLDEADVYIRKRGDDIEHNAVVAAFLRTLEYFHGLLFMTTNRAGDVDDAIVSRMIAMFKYEAPTDDMAQQLWRVLGKQFKLALSDAFINKLIETFPGISGREIKQLLKLTKQYCRRKELKITIDAFKVCAMFRGIK